MADDDLKTTSDDPNAPSIGYCVKCKEKREMKEAEQVEMPAKGGKTRPALKGKCSVCNTGMFKILPSSAAKKE